MGEKNLESSLLYYRRPASGGGGGGWVGLCLHIRESFVSFVCGLNLEDGWHTQLIFLVEMYRKVSVSTKGGSKRKPLKS